MAVLQPIVNIAEICARKGVNEFILSPGSRCAPLTIALVRHPEINTRSVSDERSAGFIALGMAQMSRKPVGMVCTSGTAVLNYSPAIAEAFYQQIPLIVLTADRPPEWTEQQDGQTINQRNIFGPHVKASFELPVDYAHADAQWHVNRIINEAINISKSFPAGPVHVNIPLREPFYPTPDEQINYEDARIIEEEETTFSLNPQQKNELINRLAKFKRRLVVAGQMLPNHESTSSLTKFSNKWQVPVVADIISNAAVLDFGISHQDGLLMSTDQAAKEQLKPELLITFGNSVISKNLKIFLRNYSLIEHWHIQAAGKVADTFQTLTKIIRIHPKDFFEIMAAVDQHFQLDAEYLNNWLQQEEKTKKKLSTFFAAQPFSEFEATERVLKALPENAILHLANSMAVRYANFIGTAASNYPTVFANRGTSGIDGSNSTAVGAALTTDKIVTLITGDVAFFYDRNAFWINFLPKNLRVILLNNNGGGIFRMIDGPGKQPELDEYFETRQLLNAQRTAEEAGMEYIMVENIDSLNKSLSSFYSEADKAKILEIKTDSKVNTQVFTAFKEMMKNLNKV